MTATGTTFLAASVNGRSRSDASLQQDWISAPVQFRSHGRSHRQFAFLATLEKEAESLLPELEPYLTTCVADPRLLDEFRCGMVRDESGAWGTFFRAVARRVVMRKGDNTYLIHDETLRGALHVADDDGRLAQGLPKDLNLNPEIGCMWMERGKQAQIVTPGTNVKRYLAGSMSWRTGELVVTEGQKRNAELFVAHLEQLRHHFHQRPIHVICDNARFHTIKGSKVVRAYLAKHGDRIVLHYLPAYSPQTNPIEPVWWHLREEITRNHRCDCIEELVKLTMAWLDEHGSFKIEGRMYQRLKQAVM